MNGLLEYLKAHPPKGFKSQPRRVPGFDAIEWFWEDVRAVAWPIQRDGKWVGSLYAAEDGRIVGVRIHQEAIEGSDV